MQELWSERAAADYAYWKSEDPGMKARIDRLVDGIKDGSLPGRPLSLKGDLEGWFVRNIRYDHCLVDAIRDGKLLIASCRYHP